MERAGCGHGVPRARDVVSESKGHASMSGWSRAVVPEGAFIQPARVRSYEVERNGCIGIGTILRYFESVATEASAAVGFDPRWYERAGTAFVVRDMDVVLGSLPGIGEDVLLATWVSSYRKVQAGREYAICRREDGRLVARASSRWAYVDRERGQPVRLFDGFHTSFPLLDHRMPPRHMREAAEDAGEREAVRHELLVTAREYEMDTQQHINNCVYVDWMREGLYRLLRAADGQAQWAAPRDGREPRARAYQIEYVRPALAGDELRVMTSARPAGSRGLRVRQEIANARDGNVCVRAWSLHLWGGQS